MSKRRGIYSAGPMEDVSWGEMTGWRDKVDLACHGADIKHYDPTRRGILHERFDDPNVRARIVQQDLDDISQCKVVIANFQGGGRGLGTMAEIALAQRDRRVVILVMDEDHFKHPFLYHFATEIHTDLDEAIEAAVGYFE